MATSETAPDSPNADHGVVDVSFIMAARNALPFIEDAIRSALDQTGCAVEIVVVDDGSTDGTGAVLARLAADEPRLRIVSDEGAHSDRPFGPSAARNLAMRAARGRWLAILDADDLIVANRTETLLDLATAAGADIIADNPIPFSAAFVPTDPAMLERGAEPYLFEVDALEYLGRNRMLTPGVKLGYLKPMFRNDFVRARRLRYDERVRLGEDFLFCLDALAADAHFLVSSFAGYGYRRSTTSLSHRIRAIDIERLDEAFADGIGRGACAGLHARSPEMQEACRRYRKSLRTARAVACIVDAAGSGRWLQGLGQALGRPDAWRFLTASLLSAAAKRLRAPRLAAARQV